MSTAVSTSDWKAFRRRVPAWRERYLRLRNEEFVGLLSDEAHTPTERFWQAKERMGEEARVLRACLDGHSKGKVAWHLFLMHGHGLIGEDDLLEFARGSRRRCGRRSASRRAGSPAGSPAGAERCLASCGSSRSRFEVVSKTAQKGKA